MAQLITQPQIKKLWVMARELGMDEVDLRGVVYNITGSDHISTLTVAQAARVIDYLQDRLDRQYRPEMASKAQVWKINKLAGELGWADNPKRLKGFVKKYAKVEDLRWLTARAAWQIIEGLKKLLERQAKVKTAKASPEV